MSWVKLSVSTSHLHLYYKHLCPPVEASVAFLDERLASPSKSTDLKVPNLSLRSQSAVCMNRSYLTEAYLAFYTSWSKDITYTICCLEPVNQSCLCVCVYCRICWHTGLPVPWGVEEGGIWQTCGHLGLRWVAQRDTHTVAHLTHIWHCLDDYTQKNKTH